MGSEQSSKTVSDDAIQHLFETIWADHRKTVRRVARQFVREASVMDVEQEALWVAYRKLPQLRDTRAVRAWLATLTRRIAQRHVNRKARQLGDIKSSDEERESASDGHAATSFSEWEGRFENVSLLRQLCGTISPGDLTILVGLHVEDRSLRDIAGEVGLSEVNVKVRAHRARNRLMKELEKGKIAE